MIKKIITLKIVIVVCLFQINVFGQNDTDHSEKASVILYSGIKLPESASFDTETGFWMGITLDIPLGTNWSLEPDLNYWRAEINNHPVIKDVHILGGSLLLAYTLRIQDFPLRLAGGLGFAKEGSSSFSKNPKKVILINLEISSQIDLSKSIGLVPKIRYQKAASLSTGGGDIFKPFLIGFGIQYKFFKNYISSNGKIIRNMSN